MIVRPRFAVDIVSYHASDQDRTDWRGTHGDGARARISWRPSWSPHPLWWPAIRRKRRARRFEREVPGAKVVAENGPEFAACDVVILAVKPQTMKAALEQVRGVDSAERARGIDRGRRHDCETRGGTRAGSANCPRDAEHALPDWPRRECIFARSHGDGGRRRLVAQLLSAVGVAYRSARGAARRRDGAVRVGAGVCVYYD